MGKVLEQINKIVEAKRNKLGDPNLSREDFYKLTAELVLINEVITHPNYKNLWEGDDSALKPFLEEVASGVYTMRRRNKLDDLIANTRDFYQRMNLSRSRAILPKEAYPFIWSNINSFDPGEIRNLRGLLIENGILTTRFYRKPAEGVSEAHANALVADLGVKNKTKFEENAQAIATFLSTTMADLPAAPGANPGQESLLDRMNRYAARAGLKSDNQAGDASSVASLFYAYLMSKFNTGYDSVLEYNPNHPQFRALFDEFMTFCKEHPTVPLQAGVAEDEEHPAVTPEAQAQNLKSWIELFNKCSDKFAEYQFPDVDYTNPADYLAHEAEFSGADEMIGGLRQQLGDHLLLNENNAALLGGLNDQEGRDLAAEAKEKMKPAFQVEKFAKSFKEGYFAKASDFVNDSEGTISRIASQRFIFETIANRDYRGKTAAEVAGNHDLRTLYESDNLHTAVADAIQNDANMKGIVADDVANFIKTGEGNYRNQAKTVFDRTQNSLKQSFNYAQAGSILDDARGILMQNVCSQQKYRDLLKDIFADGKKDGAACAAKLEELLHPVLPVVPVANNEQNNADNNAQNNAANNADNNAQNNAANNAQNNAANNAQIIAERDRLTAQSADMAQIISDTDRFLDKLLVQGSQSRIFEIAGVQDPFTALKVGGKTAEEKWGEKYGNLEPEKKRTMLKLELVNAIARGVEEVTFDHYVVTGEDRRNESGIDVNSNFSLGPGQQEQGERLVKVTPTPIVESSLHFERIKDYLSEILNLNTIITSTVHQNMNSNYLRIRPTSKNLKAYNDMARAYQKVVEACNLNRKSAESYPTTFRRAIEDYLAKAEAFYNAEISYLRKGSNMDWHAIQFWKQHKKDTCDKVKEQLDIINTKALGLKLEAGEGEDPEKYSFDSLMRFCMTHAGMKKLPGNSGAFDSNDMQEIEGEFAFLNEQDFQAGEEFLSNEQHDLIINSFGARIGDLNNLDNRIGSNIRSILALDVSDISTTTGKKYNSASLLLGSVSVPQRMTGEIVFLMYLLGTGKINRFEEVFDIIHAHDKNPEGEFISTENHNKVLGYEKDFLRFVAENPVVASEENCAPGHVKTAFKAWSDIYRKAMVPIKNYTLPEIDLSDPEQVRDNQELIIILRNFGVDTIQEINRLLRGSDYSEKFFNTEAEAFRNEKEAELDRDPDSISECRRFYSDLQNLFASVLDRAYVRAMAGRGANELIKFAFFRDEAGRSFAGIGGKTIGYVVNNNTNKGLYNKSAESLLETALREGKIGGVRHGFNVKMAYNYLTHKNHGALLREKEAFRNAFDREMYSTLLRGDEYLQKNNYIQKRPIKEEYRKILTSLGEDADSMKDFLEMQLTGDGFTGMDLVFQHSKWYTEDVVGLMKSNRLNVSDMVYVNGEKASEKWSKKYKNEEPGRKELLIRAEIVRAMAEGKSTIAFREIYPAPDNKVVITDPEICLLPTEQMKSMLDYYVQYKKEILNLENQLKDFKERLKETQEDENANFEHSQDREGEGTDRYKNMTVAIEAALRELRALDDPEKENHHFSNLKDRLETLQSEAETYYQKRKGVFFSPRKGKGTIRLGISDSLRTDKIQRLEQLRAGFLKNFHYQGMTLSRLAEKSNDFQMNNAISGVADYLNRTGELNTEKMEESYVRENLRAALDKIKKSPEYERIMGLPQDDPHRRAVVYLTSVYLDRFAKELTGEAKRPLKFEDLRKAENFWADAELYRDNMVFQESMRKSPEYTIRTWPKIENRAKTQKNAFRNELRTSKNRFHGFERFIIGQDDITRVNNGLAEEDRINVAEEAPGAGTDFRKYLTYLEQNPNAVPAANGNQQPGANENAAPVNPLAEKYEKLAQIVVNQILTEKGEDHRQLMQWVVSDENMAPRQQMIHELKDLYMQQNLLGRDMCRKCFTKLNSGALMREGTARFKAQFLETGNEAIRQSQADRNLYNNIERQDTVSPNQLDSIKQRALISDVEEIKNGFVAIYNEMKGMRLQQQDLQEINTNPNAVQNQQGDTLETMLSKMGVSYSREDSMYSLYISWLMGHKNLSFTDALKYSEKKEIRDGQNQVINAEDVQKAEEYRREYLQFVHDNPVDESKVRAKSSIENWAEVLRGCTEKMKEYEIPQINYRNNNEIKLKLKELRALSGLIINVFQEYDSIFGHIIRIGGQPLEINGFEIAKDKLGGENRYNEIDNFWWNLSTAFSGFENGFLKENPELPEESSELASRLSTLASTREVGVAQMERIKGMKASAAAEMMQRDKKNLYLKETVMNLYQPVLEDDETSVKPLADLKTLVDYMTGVNPVKFRGIAEKTEKKISDGNKQNYIKTLARAYGSFRTNLKFENADLFEELRSIPEDDVDAMEAFLERPVNPEKPDGYTVQDWMESHFHSFAGGVVSATAANAGIPLCDLFLVGGETPSKKWGEKKYGKIADAGKKSKLLNLEIIKAIAKGEEDVRGRMFRIHESEMLETKSANVMPKRDEGFQDILDGVNSYKIGIQSFIAKLEEFKTTFADTQLDRNANFDVNNPDNTEGKTSYYKDMTAALRDCLEVLKREQSGSRPVVTRKEIDDALEKLEKESKTYYDTHNVWYRARYGNGITRKEKSLELTKYVADVRNRMEYMRGAFDCDIQLDTGKTFKNTDVNDLIKEVGKMEDGLFLERPQEQGYYNRVYFKNIVNGLITDFEAVLKATGRNVDNGPLGRAKEYIITDLRNRVGGNDFSEKDLYSLSALADKWVRIAGNPVFQNWYLENREECTREWLKVEKRAQERRREARQYMDTIKNEYGNPLAVIVGLDRRPGNPYSKNEIRAKLEESDQEAVDKMYDQLALYVTWTMISGHSDATRHFSTYLYKNSGVFKSIYNYIKSELKQGDYLTRRNLDTTMEYLENGLFASLFLDVRFKQPKVYQKLGLHNLRMPSEKRHKEHETILNDIDELEDVELKKDTDEPILKGLDEIEEDGKEENNEDEKEDKKETGNKGEIGGIIDIGENIEKEMDNINILENTRAGLAGVFGDDFGNNLKFKPGDITFNVDDIDDNNGDNNEENDINIFKINIGTKIDPNQPENNLLNLSGIDKIDEAEDKEDLNAGKLLNNVTFDNIDLDQTKKSENKEDSKVEEENKDEEGPKVEDNGPKVEDNVPKVGEEEPKVDGEGPKVEDNGPKAGGEEPKIEDNEPKIVIEPKNDANEPKNDANEPKNDANGPKNDANGPKNDINGPKIEAGAPKIDVVVPKIKNEPKNEIHIDNQINNPDADNTNINPPKKKVITEIIDTTVIKKTDDKKVNQFGNNRPFRGRNKANPKPTNRIIVVKKKNDINLINNTNKNSININKNSININKNSINTNPGRVVNNTARIKKSVFNFGSHTDNKNNTLKLNYNSINGTVSKNTTVHTDQDWMSGPLPSEKEVRSQLGQNGASKGVQEVAAFLVNSMTSMKEMISSRIIGSKNAEAYRNNSTYDEIRFMDQANHYLNEMLYPNAANQIGGKMKDEQYCAKVYDLIFSMDDYMNPSSIIRRKSTNGKDWENYTDNQDIKAAMELEKRRISTQEKFSYQFPIGEGTSLPDEIIATGNTQVLSKYLSDHKTLGVKDKKYLTQTIKSNDKIQKLITNVQKSYQKGVDSKRLKVSKNNTGRLQIQGTRQAEFQTSQNGCWSCSMLLLLQSRGITGLNQEDIRLYRNNLTEAEAKKYQKRTVNNMAIDDPIDMREQSHLVSELAPDSTLKDLKIKFYNPRITSITPDEYIDRSVNLMAETIRHAIDVDQSPVSLLRSGHYVTIVGIEDRNGEPFIEIKNSIENIGDTNPDQTKWVSLKDEVGPNLYNEKVVSSIFQGNVPDLPRGVSLSWLSDLKIDPQTNKFIDVPTQEAEVNPTNGTLIIANPENSKGNWVKDERHTNGQFLYVVGGNEASDLEMNPETGLLTEESAYVPRKNINYKYLAERTRKLNITNKNSGKEAIILPDKYEEKYSVSLKQWKPADLSNNQKLSDALIAFACVITQSELNKKTIGEKDFQKSVKQLLKESNRKILTEILKKHSGTDIKAIVEGGKIGEEITKTEGELKIKSEPFVKIQTKPITGPTQPGIGGKGGHQ